MNVNAKFDNFKKKVTKNSNSDKTVAKVSNHSSKDTIPSKRKYLLGKLCYSTLLIGFVENSGNFGIFKKGKKGGKSKKESPKPLMSLEHQTCEETQKVKHENPQPNRKL